MLFDKLSGYLTNGGKYTPEDNDYPRVVFLNILLLSFSAFCLGFSIIDILLFDMYTIAIILFIGAFFSAGILTFFHLCNRLKITSYLFLIVLAMTLILFFHQTHNNHFAFIWATVLPPVAYLLLGKVKANIINIPFLAYMLHYMMKNIESWTAATFDLQAIFNIIGAMLSLVFLISYYEDYRKKVAQFLEKSKEDLKESRNELKYIFDATAQGIYGVDLNGKCVFCNRRCIELLGYKSEKDLIGKTMHQIVHHSEKNKTKIPFEDCKVHKSVLEGKRIHVEHDIFWRDNNTFFDVEYYSNPKYKNGEIEGAVVTFLDITKRKKNEEKIQYLNDHDALTGLLNRQSFERELKKYDNFENLPLSIIYCDLNGLKLTNDIFGHTAGDELIIKAAEVLKNACREEDVIARFGGDEFVWILPSTDVQDVKELMEGVKQTLAQEKTQGIRCSIAMGFSTKYTLAQSIEQTQKNAEIEMYWEKSTQRKKSESEMIHELIASLHKKSAREKTHSENTSYFCYKMGQALGWADADIKKISDAGYYHDIGKVVLSEHTLNKISILTQYEETEKQRHSIIGYRILNLFEETLDLADAVYYHHERWDGLGYPKGLCAEEIPVQARIIAIAEQYDHLTNQPLKKPLSKEDALKRIVQFSGKKFDPDLVKLFVKIVEDDTLSESSFDNF